MDGDREFTFESLAGYQVTKRIVISFVPGEGWSGKVYGELSMQDDQPVRPVISRHYAQEFAHLCIEIERELDRD